MGHIPAQIKIVGTAAATSRFLIEVNEKPIIICSNFNELLGLLTRFVTRSNAAGHPIVFSWDNRPYDETTV